MTIQEAIQSGKPFKRPHDEFYFIFVIQRGTVATPAICWENVDRGDTQFTIMELHDILATDWQTKEEEK